MELVTEGKFYDVDGTFYLLYDDSTFSGVEGWKNKLIIDKNRVCMTRDNEGLNLETTIKFEKGKRHTGVYGSEFGPIEMEVLTNDLVNTLDSEGKGRVGIDYNISLKGLSEGRSRLDIEIENAVSGGETGKTGNDYAE